MTDPFTDQFSYGRTTPEFRAFHRDDGGAILLFCLAGVLILLLVALMVFDAGVASKDKTRVQSSADFAALSQASVKARSMNMLAYANISKRSIWAIHSLYPAHVHTFRDWISDILLQYCEWDDDEDQWVEPEDQAADGGGENIGDAQKCREGLRNLDVYELETGDDDEFRGDFYTFTGNDYSDDMPQGDVDYYAHEEIEPDSSNSRYHANDLKAIDNYQRYIVGATPWWAWTRQLMTGIRNGASVTASFPPPPGEIGGVAGEVASVSIGDLVGRDLNNYTNEVDRLPVEPWSPDSESMAEHISDEISGIDLLPNPLNFDPDEITDPFVLEHLANNFRLFSRSGGAYDCMLCNPLIWQKTRMIWQDAPVDNFRDVGLDYTQEAIDRAGVDREAAEPWSLQAQWTRSDWLTSTSNLVLSYLTDHGEIRGEAGRDKYAFVGGEDSAQIAQLVPGDPITEGMYEAVGYWGMARSEIAFTGRDLDQPDLWHPSWTAKLRPVALPGEFEEQDYQMGNVYHDLLPYIRLAHYMMELSSFRGPNAARTEWDLARMEWMMHGMSQSVAEGIAK